MALGAKLNVTFQRRFLAFWNPLDPYNGNPFGLIYFSDFLEFVDTLTRMLYAGRFTLIESVYSTKGLFLMAMTRGKN